MKALNFLANNIRKYRTQLNLKQEEVAAYVGKSKNVVTNWEKGTNKPDVEVIAKLCELFHVEPNDLFGWIEEKPTVVNDRQSEIIKLYDAASPELQAAALAMLEAAEAARLAQNSNNSKEDK